MKINKITLFAVTAGCLLFSGLAAAEFVQAKPVPEQVTTNVLLREILSELKKGNALKEREAEKNHIQAEVSAGKNTDSGEAVWYKTKIRGSHVFKYADLASLQGNEAMMKINSIAGHCEFVLGFYVLPILENTEYQDVNGRVESGQCDGKKIEKGWALASVEKNKTDGLLKFSETVMIVVPDAEFYH